MIKTARALKDVPGKTIALTGSMQPARLRVTDAGFNLGTAIAAVLTLPPGVYLAMNGRIFNPPRAGEILTAIASTRLRRVNLTIARNVVKI